MTKQNENNHMTGEDQISELVHASVGEQELNEEVLAEISGAGFGTAQHGLHVAGTYGGNTLAKVKSYVHGLFNFDSRNGSYKTYEYALKQAAANPKK